MGDFRSLAREREPQEAVPLTADEIRTALMIIAQYRAAAARLAMAQELEQTYMDDLRVKYGLGPEWVCNDVLTGFESAGGGTDEQDH